jgi:hypothetical protein
MNGDTAELRRRQIRWQDWRNTFYGDMRSARKNANRAGKYSQSERAIEGSFSHAQQLEDAYTTACRIDAEIKLSRREERFDDHEQALTRAEQFIDAQGYALDKLAA